MLEEQFFLVKNLGVSIRDVLAMPIQYRKWWIQREITHNKAIRNRNKDISKK